MSYPKFKYHKEFDPMLVLSAEEEKALGDGWEETPAAFLLPAAAPAVEIPPHVKKVMAVRKKKADKPVETKVAG